MTHAIIGAKGSMGRNLLQPLLVRHGEVLAVDLDATTEERAAAWQADVIWLTVPRDVVPELVADVSLRPDQLIVDICSLKRRLSLVLDQTGAAHLSLHPLHGPHVPLEGQRWAIINTNPSVREHPHAKALLEFLKADGITFVEIENEDAHDFMMGITLSAPELFTLVIDEVVSRYAESTGQKRPPLEKLMEWSVPASNALFSAYVHAINSSADWLRRDLLLGMHGDLIGASRGAFTNLAALDSPEIERRLAEQRALAESLPIGVRKRIQQWIERWYVDATQNTFSFTRRKPRPPHITLQYRDDDTQAIFPVSSGKVSVGIHGIEGAFTHESVLRVAQELNIDPDALELQYLVTADEVLKAVTTGAVTRGVFAMANSGSGAYVSSMRPMGHYRYDVRCVYGMEIMQCLIVHPSVESIDDIDTVFGHPQAVSQCKRTFAEKYPQLKLAYGEDSDDTALCVKRIAEGDIPPSTGTLASQVAATHYGMKVLEYGMHHDPFNTTTFLVVAKTE